MPAFIAGACTVPLGTLLQKTADPYYLRWGMAAFVMLFVVILVSAAVYVISFLLLQALSRYREFAADRGSAILTGRPSALISALFGYSQGPDTPLHSLLVGVAGSIFIATPIMLVEIKGQRRVLRRLRRLPLAVYLGLKIAFYLVVIVVGLVMLSVVHLTTPERFASTFGASLVFATIYAEAQRRYFESVAPYARRLIDQLDAPKVDEITGLPPAVALRQQRGNLSARSTVV